MLYEVITVPLGYGPVGPGPFLQQSGQHLQSGLARECWRHPYRIFEEEKLPHPHLTIRALRAAEYLQPLGEGIFRWKEGIQ